MSVIFSIFNIGTGHTQQEPNNTMKVLYDECLDPYRMINDGPVGTVNEMVGWGLNTKLEQTMAKLKRAVTEGRTEKSQLASRPKPTRVNMAGHSRGSVLCHMLAHAIGDDPVTHHLEINMIVIDPVHMSWIGHLGAESLTNARLRAYHAIIMENENTWFLNDEGLMFPFKFAVLNNGLDKRTYYINMPGTHGSGTQALTNPIGKVIKELIKNFMSFRGSVFDPAPLLPIRMCNLFAEIHRKNPVDEQTGLRTIYNDDGSAKKHVDENWTLQSSEGRQAAVAEAIKRNVTKRPKRIHLKNIKDLPYFFNQKHAYLFSRAFPNLFRSIGGEEISFKDYRSDMNQMEAYRNLMYAWEKFNMDGELTIEDA